MIKTWLFFHAQRGFTLLEAMVTVAILAILVSIGVPSFRDMAERYRVTTVANDLLYYLQLARSEAVKRNRPAFLCPVNNNNDCSGINTDWRVGWHVTSKIDDPTDPSATLPVVIRVAQPFNGLTLLESAARIEFSVVGSVVGTPTNFTVTVDDKTRYVCLRISGAARGFYRSMYSSGGRITMIFHSKKLLQHGLSLLEALITMTVLSVGLLSVAALQSRSLQVSHLSYQRSIAISQADDAIERLWGGICQIFHKKDEDEDEDEKVVLKKNLADIEQHWKADHENTLINWEGSIDIDKDKKDEDEDEDEDKNFIITVKVKWDDKRVEETRFVYNITMLPEFATCKNPNLNSNLEAEVFTRYALKAHVSFAMRIYPDRVNDRDAAGVLSSAA
ncbi:MAG: GspH/FimT family pseudopilin [Chromatiales bacterium]|nr:GspH/FimT family pseudopilin [Chromatiales bacterium]